MNIIEVSVGELTDFINSAAYNRLDIKPITPQRAVSQSKNPDALKGDLALVYASENNSLLSFAGLIPARLNHSGIVASSNSGWWVNPDKGKTMGLPVFLRAFHGCGRKMFLTDCSAYTKEILEKTGYFEFFPPVIGKRWFLRFYTARILNRKDCNPLAVNMMKGIDHLANLVKKPWDLTFAYPGDRMDEEILQTGRLENNVEAFIDANSGNFFIRQDINRLNWMVGNPWVTTDPCSHAVKYPFTTVVENFLQYFLVIRKKGVLKAVVLLSVRDNHVSVPFYYGPEEGMAETAMILRSHILSLHANSLIVYHAALIRAFDRIKLPAYYSTHLVRHAGYSKELSIRPSGAGLFQDGEADVVFT